MVRDVDGFANRLDDLDLYELKLELDSNRWIINLVFFYKIFI